MPDSHHMLIKYQTPVPPLKSTQSLAGLIPSFMLSAQRAEDNQHRECCPWHLKARLYMCLQQCLLEERPCPRHGWALQCPAQVPGRTEGMMAADTWAQREYQPSTQDLLLCMASVRDLGPLPCGHWG